MLLSSIARICLVHKVFISYWQHGMGKRLHFDKHCRLQTYYLPLRKIRIMH
jgi:hypothetical protein